MPYPALGPFQTQGKWELSSAGVPLGSFLLAGKVRAFPHSLPPPLTAALARLLHPSSAGRGSSACTCEWSNVTAFTSVLPASSHKPGTSVRAVPTHLPPPHTASFSFMSHLESLTPTSNLSRFYTPPVALLCPSLQKGAQIMIRASSRVRWRPGVNVYSADGN